MITKTREFRVLAITLVTVSLCCRDEIEGCQSAGRECGIYALAAAAESLGVPVDRSVIAGGEYVDSRGSSAAQLVDFATRLGLWCRPVQRASVEFIRHSPHPVILNLKLDSVSELTGHWVTFLGDEDGAAIIFDSISPEKIQRTSYGELSLLMSGEAIFVALERPSWPGTVVHTIGSAWATWCWLMLSGVLYWFACLQGSWSRLRGLSGRFLALLLIGLSSGLFAWWFSVTGPGRNRSAVAWVHSHFCTEKLPVVQLRQFGAMLDAPEVAIIDARPRWMFQQLHVPGAVNFPIDSRPDELVPFVKGLVGKKAAIVYCSTSRCEWDVVVANRLKAAGVPDVRVFELGLEGYVSQLGAGSPIDAYAK